MNKLKGYVLYSDEDYQALNYFLEENKECSYLPVSQVSKELILEVGKENLFNIENIRNEKYRSIKDEELIDSLTQIKCWKIILDDDSIQDEEFVLITDVYTDFLLGYYSAITQYIDSFLLSSKYEIGLLNRAAERDWNHKNAYSTSSNLSSYVYSLPEAYDSAGCKTYIIRKRQIRKIFELLSAEKPFWLSTEFSKFCDFSLIVQFNYALAAKKTTFEESFYLSKLPKFSVIIPVYNVENYISEAINSVLQQDYKNYEIILVDDDSTDNSAQICFEYAKKYPNITFLTKGNAGPSVARNMAMRIARGEYLMYLDSDDFWEGTTVFSDLDKIVSEKPVDFVLSYITSIFTHETVKHIKSSDKLTGEYKNDFFELVKHGIYQGYPVIKTVKKSFIEKNHIYFPEGIRYEDVLWSYNLAKHAQSYAMYHSAYYMYRRERPGAATSFVSPEKVSDMIKIFEICHQDLQDTIIRDNVYQGLKLFITNFGKYINLCHSKLFDSQKETIKLNFKHFSNLFEQY